MGGRSGPAQNKGKHGNWYKVEVKKGHIKLNVWKYKKPNKK